MSAKDVQQLRAKLEMSQEELAHAFGMTGRHAISRWETGERQLGALASRLVRFLNALPKAEAARIVRKLADYQ